MEKDYAKSLKYTVKILDAWLPWKISYDRIPGIVVGIVYKGKLVYQKGFGYLDVEKKILMTPKTSFRIASLSKTFTTVAIMQLVEEGKIKLDDSVQKYLNWFKGNTKEADLKNITIRQLLSHTGGVFRDGDTSHWADGIFPDATELKKAVSARSVVFENATHFKYSNFGFAVLGEVIRKVSGLSYEKYVTENIIEKLRLERTSPDYNKESEVWISKGYSRPIPGKGREAFSHSKTNAYAPATGFLSNVTDLAKFISALSLKQKKADAFLGRESKKEMMKAHWRTGEEDEEYGLGLDIYKIKGRKIVGHSGGFAGFVTEFSLDVKNDIGVITLTNTNDSSGDVINSGIFETVYGLVDEGDMQSENKKILNQERFEGIYRSQMLDAIVVGIKNTLLSFSPKSNSPLRNGTILKLRSKNKFLMETKSNFASQGEMANFIFRKEAKKASRVFFGAMPLERLEKESGE